MAKDPSSQLKTTTGYLKGKVEDGETVVNEAINNDIVNFFVKLMNLAGITYNGNYDNETNDYQLLETITGSSSNDGLLGQGRVKVIEIGDWNMTTGGTKGVALNLAAGAIVTGILFEIRNDAGNYEGDAKFPTASSGGGLEAAVQSHGAVTATLWRKAAGWYAGGNHQNTSYNRGYLTVFYTVP
jgi:hypothetical protein